MHGDRVSCSVLETVVTVQKAGVYMAVLAYSEEVAAGWVEADP